MHEKDFSRVRVGSEAAMAMSAIGASRVVPCQRRSANPVRKMCSSVAKGSKAWSARPLRLMYLMFNDGNTTSVPHVLSVVRTNLMRAGVPARNVTFAGSQPCS